MLWKLRENLGKNDLEVRKLTANSRRVVNSSVLAEVDAANMYVLPAVRTSVVR